ncbi:hypothetical protein M9458_054059, partial [Cirrhinus mrigala]
QNNEEIIGKTLVDLVPVCQINRSPSTASDTQFEFVLDSDSGLWRSHLDMHRMKHTTDETEHGNNSDTSEASSTSSESERLSEDSNPGEHHLKNKDHGGLDSRKFSAPAVLSRQLSFGSYRSTPASLKYYYPFPQRKSLRKSETARRLGLYASL